jgi:TM2 domain-containing membrane protein YozV
LVQWYCSIAGQRYGPVPQETLRQWAQEGRLGRSDLVWGEMMDNWVPAGSVPELFAGAPPPMPPASGLASAPASPELKSKLAAGLLGILVGTLGIHNVYLGYTNRGLAQLLITVLTCGFGSMVTWVWGLVEGIMILTGSIDRDAQGRPLRD